MYIASSYTKGDQAINTRTQCKIWDQLMNDGVVWPIAPLWSHFQHFIFPRPYNEWTEYDNALIPRYDACFRVDSHYWATGYYEGESSGADAEVKLFESLGKPVFTNTAGLYKWTKEEWNGKQMLANT